MKRRILETFLTSFLLGVMLLTVQGQKLGPKVTTFTSEEYEGHQQLFCVQLFPNGRTAFGTSEGVVVYNGENFDFLQVGNGKDITDTELDSAGRLFIGGSSTMGVFLPDSSGYLDYRSIAPLLEDSLKDFGNVWNVRCDREGGVYFNSYERLFYYQDRTIEVIQPKDRFFDLHSPSSQFVIEDGDSGLYRVEGSNKTFLPGSKELVKGKSVIGLYQYPGNREGWIAITAKNGLFRYSKKEGALQPLETSPKKGWGSIGVYTTCRLDSNKNPYGACFALGTRLKGMYLLGPSGKIVHHIGVNEGIPSKFIWDISSTEGGDLWAATNDGISLIHTGLPFTIAPKERLFSGGVMDLARPQANNGSLYLANSQGGWVWNEKEKDFSPIPNSEGQCMDLHPISANPEKEDASSKILAGSIKGLLSLPVQSNKATILSPEHSRAIAEGQLTKKRQVIVSGGRTGIFVFNEKDLKRTEEGRKLKPLLSVKEIPEEVISLGIARRGKESDSLRIWASFRSKGVLKITVDSAFSGKRIEHYSKGQGLPEGTITVLPDPLSKGQNVVFGSKKGIHRFNGKKFEQDCRYGELFCKSDRRVGQIKEGPGGKIWIGDSKGGQIKCLVPKEEEYHIESSVFRGLDLGAIRAIYPEEKRTWLGGQHGLSCFYPKVKRDHDREWNCDIQMVKGSDDTLLFGGYFRIKRRKEVIKGDTLPDIGSVVPLEKQPRGMVPHLPYSENRMEFHFAAPFTDRQEAVKYSYKLAGFDTSWSDWSNKTRKEYTNLPEGSYTFKVKGRNVYLNESSTAKYKFRIFPPWYRTWTAYGGYTIAGIGFIWLIVWINGRRLVAQKQRLERTVEERTKEIQEEKAKVEEQKEKVEEAHKEITQSIDYAQKIQQALLQSEEHVSPNTPEHFILFKPQSQVSGDFYWVREHKGHLYIAAVDCTGHGVPGAFMSMLGISQLNEIMGTDELLTPGEILTDLRNRVVRELSGSGSGETAKDGMDAAMVKIPLTNPKSQIQDPKEIEFAGAQNPLYVIREGIADDPASVGAHLGNDPDRSVQDRLKPFKKSTDGIEIKGDSMPVGYDEYASGDFTTVSLEVQKGDMLYMFSDGYADQFGGPKGKKFRYGPFKKLLAELHEKPVEEQKQELNRTFEEWKGESEQEQIDDVCVIGVRP